MSHDHVRARAHQHRDDLCVMRIRIVVEFLDAPVMWPVTSLIARRTTGRKVPSPSTAMIAPRMQCRPS
jgi:hypothetical protein